MTVARWSDLPSRLYSASVLALAGFLAMFFGGLFLLVTVAGLVFVMHYELAKMQSPLFVEAPIYSSIAALMSSDERAKGFPHSPSRLRFFNFRKIIFF